MVTEIEKKFLVTEAEWGCLLREDPRGKEGTGPVAGLQFVDGRGE